MRYATWRLYWQPDSHYGLGPEPVIAARGGSAEGAFYTGTNPHDTIVGYVHNDVSLEALDEWSVTEISGEQALLLAQDLVPEAHMNSEGKIAFPLPDDI